MWQSTDIKARRVVVLLAALFVSTGVIATDKAYKSVDESGQTEYSDMPPTTDTVEKVLVRPQASQPDSAQARETVQRKSRMADQMAAERRQKQNERAVAKEQAERQQTACAASRSRLEQLESQPPNRRLVVEPDGSSRRVSWEEMQNLVDQARRQVLEDCGPRDAPETGATPSQAQQPIDTGKREKSSSMKDRQKATSTTTRSQTQQPPEAGKRDNTPQPNERKKSTAPTARAKSGESADSGRSTK